MQVAIPRNVLRRPVGTLTVAVPTSRAIFYVHEDDWGMRKYPRDCPAALRIGTWEVDRVLLVGMVLRLARSDLTTYDTWINIGDANGVRMMQSLTGQTQIDVHVVTDVVARSVRIANPVRFEAASIINTIRKREAWSDDEFQTALGRITQLYPTTPMLWQACRSDEED